MRISNRIADSDFTDQLLDYYEGVGNLPHSQSFLDLVNDKILPKLIDSDDKLTQLKYFYDDNTNVEQLSNILDMFIRITNESNIEGKPTSDIFKNASTLIRALHQDALNRISISTISNNVKIKSSADNLSIKINGKEHCENYVNKNKTPPVENENTKENSIKPSQEKDTDKQLVISKLSLDSNQLEEIAEIANDIDINTLKSLILAEKERQDDFNFKKLIGNKVEQIFLNTFSSLKLPYNVQYQGFGSHDFVVSNQYNKEFFIELKSVAQSNPNQTLKLAISQAKKAHECSEDGNFVVCAIVRPNDWDDLTINYVKDNLVTVSKIGKVVRDAIEKNKRFEELIIQQTGGANLMFDNTDRKIEIPKPIWQSDGLNFEKLIEKIVQYLE